MARLRITISGEVSLEFTCANYAKVRSRAEAFVGTADGMLAAKCRSNRGDAVLEFSPEDEGDGNWSVRAWNADFDGFFFDNTDYNVYAKVAAPGFRHLHVKSRFAADEGDKKFAPFESGSVRSGVLNFENDIGEFDSGVLATGDRQVP